MFPRRILRLVPSQKRSTRGQRPRLVTTRSHRRCLNKKKTRTKGQLRSLRPPRSPSQQAKKSSRRNPPRHQRRRYSRSRPSLLNRLHRNHLIYQRRAKGNLKVRHRQTPHQTLARRTQPRSPPPRLNSQRHHPHLHPLPMRLPPRVQPITTSTKRSAGLSTSQARFGRFAS